MLPAPPVSIPGFAVERVNGTREAVRAGGSAPLCQAIFATAIDVRLSARLPRGASTRASLVVTYPGRVVRRHVVRLHDRRGRTTVVLRAADERLPSRDFTAGTYRFAVRSGGRRASARLRLTGGRTC